MASLTPATLCTRTLSMMTTSPGFKVGASHLVLINATDDLL
jgi:hypothetical protein